MRATCLSWLIVLLAGVSLPIHAADTPFSLSIDTQNSIFLQTYGKPPLQLQDKAGISNRTEGTEKSECRDYGRQSAAEATADVQVLSQNEDSISLAVKSNSFAQGGHYRTCVTCIQGNCVGLMGNDTSGQARSSAASRIAIRFNPEYPAADYLLDVSFSAHGAKPTIRLTDASGSELPVSREGGPAILRGGKGSSYYLSVDLPSTSSNAGGCCDDQKLNSARVDVRLRKAPILDAQRTFEPYIRGGDETVAYPYVGAILLDGKLHCTGTLVATSTILTAAHCLNGYEDQVGKMSFVFGSNITQPSLPPFDVGGFDYPKGVPSGYSFNPKTLEDDIGLVYLKQEAAGIQPVKMHSSAPPSWDVILKKKSNLIFVGYGYDVIQAQPVASGIKREAAWTINGVQNRRVTFEVPGKNTCKGDSGGPAFVIQDGAFIQVGITSGGDSQCTTGFDTRIDAYLVWLKDRIR